MTRNRNSLIPFPNPLDELPNPKDNWLDWNHADARRAMWRLLDTCVATMIAFFDELENAGDHRFDALNNELLEAYHHDLLIFRQALDNHRTGAGSRT